jgi:serine protease Do
MYRIVGLVSVVILTCLSGGVVRAEKKTALPNMLALEEAFQSAIEEAEPAIACILVSRSEKFKDFGKGPAPDKPGILGDFDYTKVPYLSERDREKGERRERAERIDLSNPENIPESYGSGVVIDDKKCLILTHYHVVRGATKIYARFKGGEGSYANILAADPRSDLAVLDLITKMSLKAIKLGDGDKVPKGKLVLSIANPFAAGFRDGSPSASWGIISNTHRRAIGKAKETDLTKTLHHYGTLLETDIRRNIGCSGGALIDLRGELIGLTTARGGIAGADVPAGFAVPIDTGMKRIINVLKQGQEVNYAFLGVGFDRPPQPRGKGVRLISVSRGSPADQAGLREGDTIVALNKKPIDHVDDLFLALGMLQTGDVVEVKYTRLSGGGPQRHMARTTLAKFAVAGKIIARNRPSFRGLRVDYTSLLVQDPLRRIGLRQDIPRGVVVCEVQPNSLAATAALSVGEVITQVNGEKVATPAQFYEAVKRLKGTVEVTLNTGKVVKIRETD